MWRTYLKAWQQLEHPTFAQYHISYTPMQDSTPMDNNVYVSPTTVALQKEYMNSLANNPKRCLHTNQ